MKIKNNILVEVKNNEIKNGKFTIPKSITSIGECAFCNCSNLTSITIPTSVTIIGNSAFFGCSNLTSVYYTGNIASWCRITFGNYGSNPLYYAHNLYINNELIKDIVVPDTVIEIKKYAFQEWSGTSIIISDNVTSIGSYAFCNCRSLTSIAIPRGVTSIGDDVFFGCSSLQYNEYDNGYYLGNDNNPYIILVKAKDASITSCTINEETKFINHGAFCGCRSLTSIIIPDSVTSIGYDAFCNCYSLTSITIPNSVTSIGESAFHNCSSLTSVTIGNSVTSIGEWAFSSCRGLTSITIPDSVTSIGSGAFEGCDSLKSKKLNYKAFRIENGKLFCRNKEYKTDKRNFIRGELELCNNGIHYCTNLFEIFNYYWGEIDKDITIYEVQPDSKILKDDYSSKCCTNSIKLVKRLYKEDIIKILNGGENVID